MPDYDVVLRGMKGVEDAKLALGDAEASLRWDQLKYLTERGWAQVDPLGAGVAFRHQALATPFTLCQAVALQGRLDREAEDSLVPGQSRASSAGAGGGHDLFYGAFV